VKGFPKDLALSMFNHDSSLLAFTFQSKIPATWLDQYEIDRTAHNKMRTGTKHRKAGPHSLKTCAPYYLGVPAFWEPETGHDDVEYALKDAAYTARLTRFFLEKLDEKSLTFYSDRFLPWTRMILEMELEGIGLNLPALKQRWMENDTQVSRLHGDMLKDWKPYLKEYTFLEQRKLDSALQDRLAARKKPPTEKQLSKLYERLAHCKANVPTFNFDSPAQLQWLLSTQLGLSTVNLDGDESTGKEVLTRLASENKVVGKLLEYRQRRKLSTAFFPEYWHMHVDGRIYTQFNVTSTRTGRLSSNNPNLQQVPGHLHDLFTARPGHKLITRDLSAIEPTILAYYSEDKELCQLIQEGKRFHSLNALAMFDLDCRLEDVKTLFPKEDKVAKTVGLAILYGAGANRVYQELQKNGMDEYTLADAKRFVFRIRDLYSGVWKFKQELDRELESGAVIYNLLGRPIKIQDSQDVYMTGLNTLIQSSASDLLIHQVFQIKNKVNPLLFVHDEVVLEVKDEKVKEVEEHINSALTSFPLITYSQGIIPIRTEGKTGDSWQK
jgi:DNA polymerase I-like protein with 3'-5' exonuclease and polymerase domains